MKKRISLIVLALIVVISAFALTGCGSGDRSSDPGSSAVSSAEASAAGAADSAAEDGSLEAIAEDGTYDSKDEVALYLHVYEHLPDNYITKKEARALGWDGGSVERYAEGKCIGGDYFGNYEENLPPEDSYHECDIDTLGSGSRGAKRIVYSDDGDIYYTEDHYRHFTQLYDKDGAV